MNKRVKKRFLSIYAFVLIMIFSLLPVQNISAADASLSISLSQNSITQGTGSVTATVTVTANSPYNNVAGYVLDIKVNGTTVDEPSVLSFGNNYSATRQFNVNIATANLDPGSYTIRVDGEISVLRVEDGNEGVPVPVTKEFASRTLTITAPTTTTTTTQAPTTSTTTTQAATPTPTATQRPTQSNTPTPTASSSTAAPTSSTESAENGSEDLDYTPLTGTRMITTVDLDIREEANLSSRYLGDIPEGTVIEVKGVTDNGWYVYDLNGQDVYLAGSYLDEYEGDEEPDTTSSTTEDTTTTTDGDEPDSEETSTTAEDDPNSDFVFAREPLEEGFRMVIYEPSDIYANAFTDAEVIGEIGSELIIEPTALVNNISEESEWYEFDYNGTTAYIRAEDLRNYNEDTDAELEVFGAETSPSEEDNSETDESTTPATTNTTTTEGENSNNNSPGNITLIIGILAVALIILIIVYIILRRNLASEDEIDVEELDS